MGSGSVRVYRGLNVAPTAYDPEKTAKGSGCLGGRWYTNDDVWVHTRLSGALSYATGFMSREKSRGPNASSVILELDMPADKLAWSDAERAVFHRSEVTSDRAYLTRVGILRSRPAKTANPVEQLNDRYSVEWIRPEDFFVRRRKTGAKPQPK